MSCITTKRNVDKVETPVKLRNEFAICNLSRSDRFPFCLFGIYLIVHVQAARRRSMIELVFSMAVLLTFHMQRGEIQR